MSEKARKTNTEVKSNLPIPHSSVRFILFVFAQYKWTAFFAITTVVLACSIGQASNYLFKLIVNASEVGDSQKVLTYALAFPVVLFVVQVLYRISGVFGKVWTIGSKKYAADILVEYLLQHSHKYFSDRFAGSLLSKINNVVGAIEQFVPDLLWTHITAIVSFVITAVFIWSADTLSGVLFVILIIVLIGTNRLFAPKKKILSYRAAELGTKMRGVIVDIFSNISATRQYVRTNDEMIRVKTASEDHRQASNLNWSFTELMLLVNTGILFVFSLGIFYLLVMRWNAGTIGTGDFVLILALYSQITGTLLFVGRAFNNTARSFGEIEEGLAEILQPYEITDVEGAGTLSVASGKIEWKNVTFDYGEKEVFSNFDLVIQPGERIGLVGSSGAGKSTFVSLLLRQHELTGGEIKIDDQNIALFTQDSLRGNIAVVPQEPMLFHRSIRENIAYGKPDVSEAEVIAVAQKAEAHDFIVSLKEGYNTLVGERGIRLSGGQKQRVAIARAMLKNAPILVLDEATSALDSESEVAIQKALHVLMEGKTVIAIAHRLSTLREMDRIIVLEKGKVVEDGTHEILSKAKGTYARLWEHQAGGFLQE